MRQLLPFLLLTFFACQNPPAEYDILIQNATIYDGSGAAPIPGSIGINADTISAVGQMDAIGKTTIDARGMAVAPGFINILSWANESLLVDGRSQGDIRQGVTLEVMGEGRSMGPWNEEMKKENLDDQNTLKYDIEWTTLGEYLQHLEDRGVSCNVASFVGNGTVRHHVIGYEKRKATTEEMEQMKTLVDEAMKEGAVGLSSSLIYAPSGSADTEELIELAKVAAKYDGLYASHIRDEGDHLIEAFEEFLAIAKAAEIRSEIYHLKASKPVNWHKLDSVFNMLENARAEGLQITADMYTYNASSTGLHTQLPLWAREEGIGAMLAKLHKPTERAKVLADLEFSHAPDKILLVGFKNPDLRKYQGMLLSEVAAERGTSPENTMLDLMVEDDSRIQVVYFSMSEENIQKKIVKPWMSFCSDAGSYSAEGVFLEKSTHPRAYGSFARVLGKFSRDEGLFPLEDGIRRMTSLPAANLKLKKRGLLKPGYFADVVVFDPATITDKATFEKPHQYAVGVEHVFVNGVPVLKDGEHTGATPGRFVKGPGF